MPPLRVSMPKGTEFSYVIFIQNNGILQRQNGETATEWWKPGIRLEVVIVAASWTDSVSNESACCHSSRSLRPALTVAERVRSTTGNEGHLSAIRRP